jgi:hypothetical protein
LIRKAFPLLFAAFLLPIGGRAHAQSPTDTPETPFVKQIHRFDLALTGIGVYNTTVSGPVLPPNASDYGNGNNVITQHASDTFGGLVTLRYVAKPWIGFEYNYGFARYTENYSGPAIATFAGSLFQVQTRATEYSLGYVATPQIYRPFGLQPYFGGGAGTQSFKPTPHGGEGEPEKARMLYYYDLGVQQDFLNGHVGLRAGFRQTFFLDPDFGQNYLTILKHASTYEPVAGVYFHY